MKLFIKILLFASVITNPKIVKALAVSLNIQEIAALHKETDNKTDSYTTPAYADDIESQSDVNNYTYNKIGQLIGNKQEGNQTISYNAYGTTKQLTKTQTTGGLTYTPSVRFYYDANGFRIKKVEQRPNTGTPNAYYTYITYYVNDAAGNPLSIYSTDAQSVINKQEIPIYAAGRIGMATRNATTTSYSYELTDHLGNVRVTLPRNYNGTNTENIASYYPFGMPLPGALHSLTGTPYRYGYQGQFAEKDPETGFNAFEARMYDSRLGRWLTTDPARQYWSPYLGMGNRPMSSIDPDGGFDTKFGAWLYAKTHGGEVGGSRESGFNVIQASMTAGGTYDVNVVAGRNGSNYDFLYNSWNSDLRRNITQDAWNINFGTTITSIAGITGDISLSWILSGKDASIFPYLNTNIGGVLSSENEASVGTAIGITRWNGKLNNLSANDLLQGLNSTHSIAIGTNEGVLIQLNGSIGFGFDEKNKISSTTLSIGGNMGAGASIIPFGGYQHSITYGSKPIHLSPW